MKKDAARDALVQEARELIVAMEAALLQIESEGRSIDAINAIFRAAHTIKGSAGLFAFDSIVSFTHLLENLLDKVRNDILALDDNMMSLLLNCGDYMDALVDAIAEGNEDQDPDPGLRSELEAALNAYLERALTGGSIPVTAPTSPSLMTSVAQSLQSLGADAEHELIADINVANPLWHISLRFSPGMLRDGLDPLSFLRYLLTMGTVAYLHVVEDGMPAALEMDPELCYLGFELGFDSVADQASIENVFEFVKEDSQILLLPPHAALGDYRRWLARLPDRDSIGLLLRQHQALTDVEWQLLTLGDVNLKSIPTAAIASQQLRANISPLVPTTAVRARAGDEKKSPEQKFIKIEVSKLDQLIDLVGELVIAGAGASLVAKQKKDQRFDEATQTISDLVEQIRDAALTLRMVQINEVFQRFPRVVRDIARELGKNIELIVTGAETELDKSMVEKISDPLVHVVRNALDHGIESAAERKVAGKPETGVLRLNATHESGTVVIEVFDDGRGLDKQKILAKAIEQGLISPEQTPSDSEIFRCIFEPGFSTAEKVTALSGRGVGMDVVKRNIESLQGEVEIFSNRGQGTLVRIRLPLTLAIIAGFQVVVGGAVFVIPLDLVVECINLSAYPVQRNVVTLRGEPLPFIRLRELFDLPHRETVRKSLVVVQYGAMRAGLLVDNLLGECQAVIKPLGKLFSKVKGLSGSTILGDGRVALILDVPHLIAQTGKIEQSQARESGTRSELGVISGDQAG
ncbi:two-component system chemotaxis sensor kinase CheA [Herbaspirillum sp. Sphag1AN]|uniref:chemotaxis protein CheA n=1 Tax=unclassified Herbaspirillum TaxID=2624150 RepID=UPI00160C3881|nr:MULTISPECIES: chemotaxis protein CheA [unclassified Herbaspirillum]MBB3212856.1 two-component system chemotaxis sensor kinase CheA [Herbaspirillum sp. Sphag1AN]MBB3246053.1 two-component system chemotaxis sensor kinase CheA [Herbaspirillum sp. Sphag64]